MGAKIIVVLIAILSIIQGFAYGIISILALLAHDCQISMKQYKITYLMYIIYFRDRKCGPVNWNIVADIPPPYEPSWPPVTMVAYRTNILAAIYLILSTMWIVTSLMLIAACFLSCMGRVSYYVLTLPWAFLCTIISIFDVVAVGFFFYDLFNTLNMDAFLHHLQLENTFSLYQSLEINANILPIPAVIMLTVASRGFLFWCLNILCIPLVLSRAKRVIFGIKRKNIVAVRDDLNFERSQAQNNNNILENQFPVTNERSRYSDPSHHHHHQYDNMSYQQDKYDLTRTIGRRYIEPLKDASIDEPDHPTKRMITSRNSSNEEKSSSKKSSWSGESQNSASTVYLTNSNQALGAQQFVPAIDSHRYQSWRELPSDSILKIDRPHFRLPNKPSLLKKLSDSSYIMPDETSGVTTAYAGNELRNQMPWSYFPGRQDITDSTAGPSPIRKPKNSFLDLRNDEDLPPVPVPDYTMHMPRNDRTKNNGNAIRKSTPAKKFINPKRGLSNHENNDGRWTGPEYRY